MKTQNKKTTVMRVLFALYAVLMLYLLFIRNRTPAAGPYWQLVRENLNVIPLFTVRSLVRLLQVTSSQGLIRFAVVNLVGNVVMFLPLGFFLPRVFPRFGSLWKTLAVSALIITAIELLQLFTLCGSCDIDDLILNLIGSALGYLAGKLIELHIGRHK